MIGLSAATRIFVAVCPADMRKSFEGLSGIVRNQIGQDPTSGHLFLFVNKRRNRLKAIYWDGSGLWVLAKRLDKGTFYWPSVSGDAPSVPITEAELSAIIGGLDLNIATPRKWYRKTPAITG